MSQIPTNSGSDYESRSSDIIVHWPDGTSIPPTGKPFKLTMCTVGHWKDGVMDEEYLFWDNAEIMKQMGLA